MMFSSGNKLIFAMRLGAVPVRRNGLLGGLLALSILCTGPLWAASCPQDFDNPIEPNQMKGIRTKWEEADEVRDGRYTIQPALEGLSVGEWMKKIEAAGVNVTDVNLDPCSRLVSNCNVRAGTLPPPVSAKVWADYMAALYAPAAAPSGLSGNAASAITDVRSRIVAYGYTPEQRNQVMLDFLKRLEDAKAKGEIAGNVRFIIHQRLWFRSAWLGRPQYKERMEAGFASDMAGFINSARAQCLDHWIAGIRLGEHSNKNMDELLPIIVDLSQRVNAGTGGWLRNHMMLVNGGGWGVIYNGIGQVKDHVRDRDGKPFDFFKLISAETGSFAFGYKWMDSDAVKHTNAGIRGQMQVSTCGTHRCDLESAADWETYLRINDGFDDLAGFIHAHGRQYPKHANVMFVGDSSDSVQQIVKVSPDGKGLVDLPPLAAVRRMFVAESGTGGGWTGRMFMNAYMDRDRMEDKGQGPDFGRALYFADVSPKNFQSGPVTLMPNTLAEWRNWPAAPRVR